MKIFYVVKDGKAPGVYNNWEDCREQIYKKSGSKFNVFACEESARSYYENSLTETKAQPVDEAICIHVDSSYNEESAMSGYGCVGFSSEVIRKELQGSIKYNPKDNNGKAVGIIEAVLQATKWATDNKYKEVVLFYNNELLDELWNADSQAVQNLSEKMSELHGHVDVYFKNITIGSGNEYRERARELADKSVGNPFKRRMRKRRKSSPKSLWRFM